MTKFLSQAAKAGCGLVSTWDCECPDGVRDLGNSSPLQFPIVLTILGNDPRRFYRLKVLGRGGMKGKGDVVNVVNVLNRTQSAE
jgi:hypothetical protein